MKKPLIAAGVVCLAVVLIVAAVFILRRGQRPHHVRVGYIPIADCSQLFVAIDKGYFRDEGLEVEAVSLAGGSKILEALGSGSLDVGFSNLSSLVLAHDAGLPFVSFTGGPAEDALHKEHAILVRRDSSIKDVSGLTGKRIALNTRKNIDELMVTLLLKKHNVDPQRVTFVEVPFPRMISVLQSGDVDAIGAIEPFVSFGLKQNNIALSYNYLEIQPTTDISSYVTTPSWLDENPELAASFKRALKRATTSANSDETETKNILGRFTHLDQDQLKDVRLPLFTESLSEERLTEMISRMRELGWIKGTFAAKDLIR